MFYFLFNVVGVVIGDAVGDNVVGDVERSCDSSGASHVGDDWLAREEARYGEARGAEGEVGFGALFVEFGAVDTKSDRASSAISNSFGVADEAGEGRIISVVFIQNNDFWVHLEQRGFTGGVFFGSHGAK